MELLKKIIDRIGLTILKPSQSFDLLTAEGVEPEEGIIVTITGVLMLSLVSTLLSDTTLHPLLTLVGNFSVGLIFWILFILSLGSVIKVLYKVPGDLKEYFLGLSYALSTSILPATLSLILLIIPPNALILLVFLVTTVAVLWFVWLLILVYMFTERYFKIDLPQFFAALVVSFLVVGVVLVILSVLVASIMFLWWVI